jgi:hypothetical protein
MSKKELLESGAYRDAHLELEELLRKSGPIYEKAVSLTVSTHAPFFVQTGPDFRHRLTGEAMADWVALRRTKTAPHDYADYLPDNPEQHKFNVIEDACLRTSPKTVGALFTLLGEGPAREILKQWNVDPVRMIPGTRPEYAEKAEGKKKSEPGDNNPFNPAKKYASDDVRQNEIVKYLAAFGPKAVEKACAKYGVDIAGRPLRAAPRR